MLEIRSDKALILRLDIAGRPDTWLTWKDAVNEYVTGGVAWEASDQKMRIYGGKSRLTGEQTFLDLASIVACRGKAPEEFYARMTPALSNDALFRRDGHLCMYCGVRFPTRQLTRDHVHARALGGVDRWENVVSACKPCNSRKSDKTVEEAERLLGMKLMAVPYAPNYAEWLILYNRHILADQMEFLKKRVGKNSRLLAA